MYRKTVAALVILSGIGVGLGHANENVESPTYYRDIVPILQEACQDCHRPGGSNLGGMVAPMSFDSYKSTRPWARAMSRAVESGIMPPWHAGPEHKGQFRNERYLSESDRQTIVNWARTGAKRGNPGDAPTAREWPVSRDWQIGTPDLVLQPDSPYLVKDEVEDEYVYLTTTMKGRLSEDRYVKAVEVRAGSSAVHHIIAVPVGALVPGGGPMVFPEGIGSLLPKDFDLIWEMHYHKEPGPATAVTDHSAIAIQFYDDPSQVTHRLQRNDLGRYDFAIPAGVKDYSISKEYVFRHDSKLFSFQPHLHLRGAATRYEAFYPDGTSEMLLNVPRYDFNWQTTYEFNELKDIPAGTRLRFTTVWDNSAENPYNPDPESVVRYGLPTTSEMSLGYMSFINDSDEFEDIFDSIDPFNIGLTAVVATYDTNNDGILHRDEAPERAYPLYAEADRNADGGIDMDEARAHEAATRETD